MGVIHHFCHSFCGAGLAWVPSKKFYYSYSVATKFFKHDVESLDQRLEVLEDRSNPDSECEIAIPTKELRRDISEVRAWANDNEQYTRNQNIRITGNGLSVGGMNVIKKLLTFAKPGFIFQILDCKTLMLLILLRPIPRNLILLLV